jgi:Family of unknown function (DUF6065)
MINRDGTIIPDNKIVCVADHPMFEERIPDMIEPLRNRPHREALGKHSFHCLPLVVGNQYGFVIKSMVTWSAVWNGGSELTDTEITIDETQTEPDLQFVSSHFGSGIVTVQNRFNFRTAPGVNLMVLDPPNYFNFNLANLFAVIETDNLRRDFTFNLKIVRPKVPVHVKRGDIISAIIPVPRYFVDDFEIETGTDVFTEEELHDEAGQRDKFALLRSEVDIYRPHQVGKLYWRGLDADDVPFPDHQKRLRPAGWTQTGDKGDDPVDKS